MLEVINLLQTTYLDPGTVSVRVAFVLRSTEVIPAFSDLFPPTCVKPPLIDSDRLSNRNPNPLNIWPPTLTLTLSLTLALTLSLSLILSPFPYPFPSPFWPPKAALRAAEGGPL